MNVPNSVCSSQAQQNGSSSKPSPGGPTRPAEMSDSMRNGQVDDEGKSYCNMANEQDALEPIAVIGMAVKFPQDASSVEGFWQMLLDGRSSLTEIPKDRMNIDAYYHPDKDHFGTVKSLKSPQSPATTKAMNTWHATDSGLSDERPRRALHQR